MDKQHFDQLVKGVSEMKRHMAGKSIRGARATVVDEPDVRAIRKAADISQSQFAKLIGVNLRTTELGTAPDAADGPGTGAARDRRIQSEIGARGSARVADGLPRIAQNDLLS
jgi:DNA-binding XRE family transcriptional regulator